MATREQRLVKAAIGVMRGDEPDIELQLLRLALTAYEPEIRGDFDWEDDALIITIEDDAESEADDGLD